MIKTIWLNRELKVGYFETAFGDCYGIPIGAGFLLRGINVANIRFPVKKDQILDENSVSAIQESNGYVSIINKDVGLSLLISTKSKRDEKKARGFVEILDGKDSIKMLSSGYGHNDKNDFTTNINECWTEYLLSVNGNVAIAVRKSGIVDEHEAWYIILVQDFIVKIYEKR